MPDDGLDLARDIFTLFQARHISALDGRVAMITALVVSMVDDGASKQDTLRMVGEVWDLLEPKLHSLAGQRPN